MLLAMDLTTGAVLIVVLVLIIIGFELYYSSRDDDREPSRVTSNIPLFGHALGLMRLGTGYYSKLSSRVSHDIYTISIFSVKLYVINATYLITAVQRAAKTLSFTPFQTIAADRMSGVSKTTLKIYENDIQHDVHKHAFLDDFGSVVRKSLGPGSGLDKMNEMMSAKVLGLVDDALKSEENGDYQVKGLHSWVRHLVTIASTAGVYGEHNPFDDPRVEEAFWTFDNSLKIFFAGLFPKIFASKAFDARQRVIAAFAEYFNRDFTDSGSEYVRERYRAYQRHKVPHEDIPRLEATTPLAILSNTVPTVFWSIFHIFTDVGLLAELTNEVGNIVDKDEGHFTLDISKLKTQCPLLLSTYQEVQRTRTVHAGIRRVMDNTPFDSGRYLLKKDNFVQVPIEPLHHMPSTWGQDAANFDPYRFTKQNASKQTSSSPSQAAFLAWGMPPHLCPARQFASTEILILLALLILRVDLRPAKTADWVWPKSEVGRFVVIQPPQKDVDVVFRPHEEYVGSWSVRLGDSKMKIPLASG